jgi:hypothetical protein
MAHMGGFSCGGENSPHSSPTKNGHLGGRASSGLFARKRNQILDRGYSWAVITTSNAGLEMKPFERRTF